MSDAVDWLFFRALGPAGARWKSTGALDLGLLEGFIGARKLFPRIWARTGRETLESELASAEVEALEREFRDAVVLEMRDQEVCAQLAELGLQLEVPVLILKGLALRLAGYAQTGSRWAADVDVLVPESRARELHRAVVDRGGMVKDLPASDQHLPVLEHPSGALVEIHHRLRGIDPGGGGEARLEDLQATDLCEPLDNPFEGTLVPRRELLAAHLLVHALGQHAYWPSAYPQVQLLADLQDLGFGTPQPRSIDDGIQQLIDTGVRREKVDAVRAVLQRLCVGEPISAIAAQEDEPGLMARFILAGASDFEYRRALNVEGSFQVATGQSASLAALATLRKAVLVTDGQIDLIYGRPKSRWGYWGRRLWRPFDLLGRLLRAAPIWMRVRRR